MFQKKIQLPPRQLKLQTHKEKIMLNQIRMFLIFEKIKTILNVLKINHQLQQLQLQNEGKFLFLCSFNLLNLC